MQSVTHSLSHKLAKIRKPLGRARWQLRIGLEKLVDDLKWWRVRRQLAALSPEKVRVIRRDALARAFQIAGPEVDLVIDEVLFDTSFLNRFQATLGALPPEIAYPTSSMEDCITVYMVVRLLKPEVMVETGVHCGAFTAFALRAMDRNDRGTLYSIDKPEAYLPPLSEPNGQGCLVPADLRSRWRLINGDSRYELPQLLATLGTIDIFNHDSLHTLEFMTSEYTTAWSFLHSGSVLMSHDVRINRAFAAFVEQHRSCVAHEAVIYGMGFLRKSCDA